MPLDEVPEVWHGVIKIFRDYGYRRLRSRARLKFLMADWGPTVFREVLEQEYLNRKLIDGPAPELPKAGTTTSACTGRRTASSTSGSRRSSAGSAANRPLD